MAIGLGHYLTVAAMLFTIGIFGIFGPEEHHRHPDVDRADPARREHQPRGVLHPSRRHHGPGLRAVHPHGGGGEAAIGLAILVVYFRNRGTIAVDDINMMKG